jgi:hypothetical protein
VGADTVRAYCIVEQAASHSSAGSLHEEIPKAQSGLVGLKNIIFKINAVLGRSDSLGQGAISTVCLIMKLEFPDALSRNPREVLSQDEYGIAFGIAAGNPRRLEAGPNAIRRRAQSSPESESPVAQSNIKKHSCGRKKEERQKPRKSLARASLLGGCQDPGGGPGNQD